MSCDNCNVVHCCLRTSNCYREPQSSQAVCVISGGSTVLVREIDLIGRLTNPVKPPFLHGRYLLHTPAYCIFSSRTWPLYTGWRRGPAPPGGRPWSASGCPPRTAWSTGSMDRARTMYSRLRNGKRRTVSAKRKGAGGLEGA